MRGISLDWPRTRWTTERATTPIARNEMQGLSGVVRVRTWLSHASSPRMNRRKLSYESVPLHASNHLINKVTI